MLLDRPAGDPTDDLTGERTDDQAVVPVGRAGRPVRPVGGKARRDHSVVGQLVEREAAIDADDPRSVGQQLAQRDLAFAFGRELRPVLGDPAIKVESAVLNQQRDHEMRRTLDRRESPGERVAAHPVPGPEIDHLEPLHIGAELGSRVGGPSATKAANASRTSSKPGATVPCTSISVDGAHGGSFRLESCRTVDPPSDLVPARVDVVTYGGPQG